MVLALAAADTGANTIRNHTPTPGGTIAAAAGLQLRVQLINDSLAGRGSYEGAETGQGRPRPGHVVHDDLAAVQAHHSRTLRFRVGVAGVVPHRFLPLPGLPQRVVHVRVVVHERVRVRPDTFVFALGRLG